MLDLFVFTALLPILARAEQHVVKVGKNALAFEPDSIKAETGDTVLFQFWPKNHSVAQAAWDKPCEPLSGDDNTKPIFSGFFPVDEFGLSSTSFQLMINNTDPIWLYCSQVSHCKTGQVMVINPKDDSDQTLEKYREASQNSEYNGSPSEVYGGLIVDTNDAAQTTKGNPGTPATVTISSSTSGSMTSSSSTSSVSPTQSNPAIKLGHDVVVPLLAGAMATGMCGYLT